jgi:hypothetical protein
MKKWNEVVKLTAMSFWLLLFTPSFTQAQCPSMADSYDWDPCTLQGLSLGGEVIWWKPCINDLDIGLAIESEGDDFDYDAICPNWEFGFRVYASYRNHLCGCWTVSSSWTHIRPDHSSKVEFDADDEENGISPLLHGALTDELVTGLFKRVKGELDMLFNDWDLLLSYDLVCNPCYRFVPYAGLAGIFLYQDQQVIMKNPLGINGDDKAWIKWTSGYNAVGIRAGSELEISLNPCFTFFAKADGSVLAGTVNSKNKQKITFIPLNPGPTIISPMKLEDHESCHLVSGYHIAAGLTYDTRLIDHHFTFRLGYEYLDWYNIPNPRIYFGDNKTTQAAHATQANTRNLGFHGLFAGAALTF